MNIIALVLLSVASLALSGIGLYAIVIAFGWWGLLGIGSAQLLIYGVAVHMGGV